MSVIPEELLIAKGRLRSDALAGTVVIVTGAGGGIGLEAARALLWLGASVVIAELDRGLGDAAAASLAERWGERVAFFATDVGDEASVVVLGEAAERRFGKVDAVVNNATFAPAGSAVTEMPVSVWDRSYAVNLRGPVLLARRFLPGMIARKHGAFLCVSSTGGPFLAAYETLKAAQVAFANALDAELAGTGVHAFTIGPGLVATPTATSAIERLAPRLGMTVDEFWKMNSGAVLSVEAAGAGFAAAVALASRYPGQEISSSQALTDAGIELPTTPAAESAAPRRIDAAAAAAACGAVATTLAEQASGWKERSFFERQWMLRDFKQRVGVPVERCLETLERVGRELAGGTVDGALGERAMIDKLGRFYAHVGELARGYVKDPVQRAEQERITAAWRADVERLIELLR